MILYVTAHSYFYKKIQQITIGYAEVSGWIKMCIQPIDLSARRNAQTGIKMEFRPCIDIHNGKVKQIVGSSLRDEGDRASENFVSHKDAAYYAGLYREYGIKGGHIILLNAPESPYYEATKEQAMLALRAYPLGLQVGGGITAENAQEYLDAGASHVIVTSYVFQNGNVNYENLHKLYEKVGKKRLVLDVSCRKKDGVYYIVTDRWQKYTQVVLSYETLERLSAYCDEFLIHAVDVEGKADGIETQLVNFLGGLRDLTITYAGGVHSFEDLETLKQAGRGNIHVTIGSALDLFGGNMPFEKVLDYIGKE